MPELYPPSPPAEQAQRVSLSASAAHRRGVVALILGLLGFAITYLGLLLGCAAAAWLLIALALDAPILWIAAAPGVLAFAVLIGFLIKGLVHRPALAETSVEIGEVEQPQLFAFLDRLAAEAGAPRPDRVRLSAAVNAAMVPGGSALGSLIGRHRELVIGLGLVNALDLQAFKAVLAHEFGHFAQSSTRVGQRAHRVTVMLRALVLGRDRFDDRLEHLRASKRLPIAAMATAVSRGIGGVRLLLAAVLTRLTRLGLALAREMEFNADLHAVRLCGSDALIAALWQAQRGALALGDARMVLAELAKHQLYSDDLFAHQRDSLAALDARLDARLAEIDDPMLLALRTPYRPGPSLHFPPGEAPTEVMWYSHPSYAERERNAKRCYLGVDDRAWPSAWSLFSEPEAVCATLTRLTYVSLGHQPDPTQLQPAAELAARIDDELDERAQAEHYRGFYDNRVIDLGDLEALLEELEVDDEAQQQLRRVLEDRRARWRSASLAAYMDRWRGLEVRLDALTTVLARPGDPHGEFELGGESHSFHAAPRLLAEAREARARQLDEARAIERDLFCWHWLLADDETRDELLARYRFLRFVQTHVVGLNHHRARFMTALREPGTPNLRRVIDEVLTDLGSLLAEAEYTSMPALRNLVPGTALRDFLLAGALTDPPAADGPLRDWLAVFMPQVTGIHGRLRTLHYKNLGALLKLRERIDPPGGDDRDEADGDRDEADGDREDETAPRAAGDQST